MLVSVQYLRGFAALLVVFHHAIHKYGQISGSGDSWEFGASGVDLFFIISGFIMCHVTASREVEWKDFLFHRVRRIIPLYWLLTFVALAVFLINPSLVNSSGGNTSIVNSFLLIPDGNKFLIQNGWTLSYEFLFYFVFAFSLLVDYQKRYLIVATCFLSLVVLGIFIDFENPFLKFSTNSLVVEFLFGMAAYVFLQKRPGFFLSFVLIFLGIALLAFDFGEIFNARALYYGAPYALVFTGVVGLEKQISSIGNGRFGKMLIALGDSSYASYLVHPFVLAVSGVLFRKLGIVSSGLALIFVMVLASVVIGYVTHVTIERWLLRIFTGQRKQLIAS
ncbi:acyltransferase family protein [Pseudomonas citronellolis]|uniref:acyltransferase family protein n=1 Tax=Pseudomonas citronellolis TaxID=53408 RepID=UPI002D7801FF|nr:acyltransferase [Pseudomonas citronellolis]WRT83455.1 acyltransferase [Pseudomonas citronellolis]